MLKLTPQEIKDRRARVINLLKQPGWNDIVNILKDQLNTKIARLRTVTDYQLDKLQGECNGLEFLLKKVDNILKGERDESAT